MRPLRGLAAGNISPQSSHGIRAERGCSSTFAPLRGYIPDADKRWTVYYLAAGMAVFSVFCLLPGFRHLEPRRRARLGPRGVARVDTATGVCGLGCLGPRLVNALDVDDRVYRRGDWLWSGDGGGANDSIGPGGAAGYDRYPPASAAVVRLCRAVGVSAGISLRSRGVALAKDV